MTPKRWQLALRKQRLQLRSAALREEFAARGAVFAPVTGWVDRARDGVRWLGQHPEVTAGAALALALFRPKALFRWLRRGWFLWQSARRLNGLLTGGR